MKPHRMIIYGKDVQCIFGKTDRSARALLAAIRKKLNKQRHQPVTVNEFCNYLGLQPEEVARYLSD